MISDKELLELEKLVDLQNAYEAKTSFLKFVSYTMPEFVPTWFHKTYIEVLQRFAQGKIKRLIVSVPPQHGKSEQSSRRLPAYLFGVNPKLRIALASYNATFANKFNRQIQRIIDSKEYRNVFPETYLNGSNANTGTWLRNTEEFEIVGYGGFFKSVGVGGGLTGNSVDVMIMDDLYKDYADATSPTISEKVWEWYTTVVKTRLHNDSQELIVFTRWDDNDLIGRLEKKGKVHTLTESDDIDNLNLDNDVFLKINFEALKTGSKTDLDPREENESLWEEKHSKQKLEETRELDPQKFSALYQGNPKTKEGLMYNDFKTYKTLPEELIRRNYTDTADEGKDFLCSIDYVIPLDQEDENIYLLDVVFSQKGMEETEIFVSDMLNKNNTREARIESNNGGKGFARVIDSLTTNECTVNWFHQSKNKQARIFSNSASVNKTIVMPEGWDYLYPEFYNQLMNHKKDGRNKHDDAADALTGVYETEKEQDEIFFC